MEPPQLPFVFVPARRKKSKATKRYERKQAAKADLERSPLQSVAPSPWSDTPVASWDTISISSNWDTMKSPKVSTASTNVSAQVLTQSVDEQIGQGNCVKDMEGWPWKDRLEKHITMAPFYENSSSYVSIAPEVIQTSPFFRLVGNDLIRRKVMGILSRSHEAATNFSLASKRTWRMLAEEMDFWDFTQGAYNNCEWSRNDPTIPEDLQGSVAPVVIVSPFRGTPKLFAKRPRDSLRRIMHWQAEERRNDMNAACDDGYEPIYASQLKSMHKMCISVNNFADFFQNLQFHRIPFLTKDILALIIPSMRNLKHLGVLKCPLVHVGDTLELLEIIKTDRPIERERQVNLEFFPNFHIGPEKFPGDIYFTGQYGATWDNFNGRTDLAIWGFVLRIMRKVREYGIDLYGKGTAFRRWLELSPCWRIEKALEQMEEYLNGKCGAIEMIAWLDYKLYRGKKYKITQEYRQFETNAEGTKWLTLTKYCDGCQVEVLGIFWDYGSWRSSAIFNEPGQCLPCKLHSYLEDETDHFKNYKRGLIKTWLADPSSEKHSNAIPTDDLNTTNLPKAIQDFRDKKMLRPAWELDDKRRMEMFFVAKEMRVDREYAERQRPWVKKELNRQGKIMRSPWIDEKDLDLKGGEGVWTTTDETRRWAQGHWYN